MGYACPVCETPQADAAHLANHLAFTAMTRGGDHEEWLDERVPGWGQLGESELAERVVDDATDAEYPQVFEASGVDDPHDHGSHEHAAHDHGVDVAAARVRGGGALDDEARAVIEEARSLTEEMLGDDGGAGTSDASEAEAEAETSETETSGTEVSETESGTGADDATDTDDASEPDSE